MEREKLSLPHQSITAGPIWLNIFKIFVIARSRVLRKTILDKSTGKVGNLGLKNTIVAQQCIILVVIGTNRACLLICIIIFCQYII